jgi:hypothetical protein
LALTGEEVEEPVVEVESLNGRRKELVLRVYIHLAGECCVFLDGNEVFPLSRKKKSLLTWNRIWGYGFWFWEFVLRVSKFTESMFICGNLGAIAAPRSFPRVALFMPRRPVSPEARGSPVTEVSKSFVKRFFLKAHWRGKGNGRQKRFFPLSRKWVTFRCAARG